MTVKKVFIVMKKATEEITAERESKQCWQLAF